MFRRKRATRATRGERGYIADGARAILQKMKHSDARRETKGNEKWNWRNIKGAAKKERADLFTIAGYCGNVFIFKLLSTQRKENCLID